MGRLTAFLVRSFRAWERSSQIALLIALALFALIFLALLFGPPNLRLPALIGVFGLVTVVQVIFMWANRGMVTPYTQAQRFYLSENFEAARKILEEARASGKADTRALTLLGNTYRQLVMLEESQEVLTTALALAPFDHFPLYGFGRTLLIKGWYGEAVEAFTQALAADGPWLVHFDLGEAYLRQGLVESARIAFKTALNQPAEPHRVLIAQYGLYLLEGGQPPTRQLVQQGLPYWQEQAARYSHTPYGQALAKEVQQLLTLMEGN